MKMVQWCWLVLIGIGVSGFGCSGSCPKYGLTEGQRFQLTVLSSATSTGTCSPWLMENDSLTLTTGPAIRGPSGGDGEQGCMTYGAVATTPPILENVLTSCAESGTELGLSCMGLESGCAVSVSTAVNPVIGPGVDSIVGTLSIAWQELGCGGNNCFQEYNVRIDRLPVSDGGTDAP